MLDRSVAQQLEQIMTEGFDILNPPPQDDRAVLRLGAAAMAQSVLDFIEQVQQCRPDLDLALYLQNSCELYIGELLADIHATAEEIERRQGPEIEFHLGG
jgi:hypothetical protein